MRGVVVSPSPPPATRSDRVRSSGRHLHGAGANPSSPRDIFVSNGVGNTQRAAVTTFSPPDGVSHMSSFCTGVGGWVGGTPSIADREVIVTRAPIILGTDSNSVPAP